MTELRFDNRVAVITGAGRGLGAAYARLLASRGAKIVVNDPGVSMGGDGGDAGPAQQVVDEIIAAGGTAIANTDSVATPEGGAAIVEAALKEYGSVDILIHNAGIVRRGPLKELSYEDFESVLDVHLRGGFHVVRAAFPRMCDARYGRIILTGSINGLYGNRDVVNYSVAKAGLIGLSNVAAIEGEEFNIKSNIILPGAVTRMAEGLDTSKFPPMDPELVAPAVAWMAHESCTLSGEMLVSIAGRMARAYAAETRGVHRPEWTIEDVAAEIEAICDTHAPLRFPPVPTGHLDHLRYSFEMASKN
ncbi:MAG: short-chain dehydrogenase [Pseudomonadales bacterium]|uniref:SDR family NAD(P)-dependent oxidoreductase n=1 Tax=unclassified Ketobacter TaxID=2639109 RepID=UPI000C3CB1A9|nr:MULTISPECIES: SDR family NAD(P)-dependent oxidoreductase [unclassified Ketobacter]MAQ24675.1 short-chain dehydrogenase [Pseudomonadales bacterium]MEC8810047.1 SDR family NAD(P)-dependent oxidoreductase [Pseudomonadota bacterium]HAG94795.1 short-chain dehydrogenase [Gammaproteobacteria bacterium]MBI28225.1 short-chain dehydrogenase [Pseudomonadales bacterium]MCK5789900.1 SDR family NAD(P)-dependent oxidoreductase [Ketobacter sp.]|tara:strand:- start:15487 stop:16398 length:912 start_codon:yes stop_codon:yes gene_type:complete